MNFLESCERCENSFDIISDFEEGGIYFWNEKKEGIRVKKNIAHHNFFSKKNKKDSSTI